METCCRIDLLGKLRISQRGRIITHFRTQQAGALLAYLALHPTKSHTREHLVDLFWPDTDPAAGRSNLSNRLSSLRRLVEPTDTAAGSVIIADHQAVQLRDGSIDTDVMEVEQLTRKAAGTVDHVERACLLERAVGMYRGEFLQGYDYCWVEENRIHWNERHIDLLQQWASALELSRNFEAALDVAQRVIHADPYRTDVYQALMRIYAAMHRPEAIKRTYGLLSNVLQQEFNLLPDRATRSLAERLLQEYVGAFQEPSRPGCSLFSAQVLLPSYDPSNPRDALPPHSLPLPLTRFFGREEAIMQLTEHLLSDGRLVTVTGPGGVGKTRLAIEVGRSIVSEFSGRVWFVAMDALLEPSLLPSALARALKLADTPRENVLERLGDLLGGARCLLVLDNFEHLLRDGGQGRSESGSISVIRFLLERAPALTCLVTSRQALRLAGEQEFPLLPFTVPASDDKLETVSEYSCIALYIDRARAVRPSFALTDENAATVAAVCRKLEGMPLAIEMAAGWAKTVTPAKMLERLQRQLDLLISRCQDLPPRHQSLRASFAWSYDLLTPEWQRFFAKLSVFQDGWTLEAAETVCDEPKTMECLVGLQDHSFVKMEERGTEARYFLQDALAEYAAEKLSPEERDVLHQKRADYYVTLAEQADRHLQGAEQANWLDRLEADVGNLRTVLAWTVTAPHYELGLWMAGALWRFWYVRGCHIEGANWLNRLLQYGSCVPVPIRLKALNAVGNLYYCVEDFARARTAFEESLSLATKHFPSAIAGALGGLANVATATAAYADAHGVFERCLVLYRDLKDSRGIALTLANLAIVARREGDFVQACTYHLESIAMFRASSDQINLALGLSNLADTKLSLGDENSVKKLLEESLQISRALDSKRNFVHCLCLCFCLAVKQGLMERAAVLQGAEQALREAFTEPLPSRAIPQYRRNSEIVRQHLGQEAFQLAWSRGCAMTQEEVAAYALIGLKPNGPG